jgi:hypothetical protein
LDPAERQRIVRIRSWLPVGLFFAVIGAILLATSLYRQLAWVPVLAEIVNVSDVKNKSVNVTYRIKATDGGTYFASESLPSGAASELRRVRSVNAYCHPVNVAKCESAGSQSHIRAMASLLIVIGSVVSAFGCHRRRRLAAEAAARRV